MDFSTLQIKEIGVWPLWLRGIVILIIILLLTVIMHYLLWTPKLHVLSLKKKQLQNSCNTFTEQHAKSKHIEATKQYIIAMQQQYANYAQYTSADSMADCISNLTKLADRNGLRISAIKPGDVAMQVVMVGAYHAFAKFISEMFTLPVPLGVGDFIIYREENLDSNTDQLLINITINWKNNIPLTTEPLASPEPYVSAVYTAYNLRSPFYKNIKKSEVIDNLSDSLVLNQEAIELESLTTEFITINYAKATDIIAIIKDNSNPLLSTTGQVSLDARTNTLLLKDTSSNVLNIKQLLKHLDVPIRQVMIEAQIVETTSNYRNAFGLQMQGNYSSKTRNSSLFFDFNASNATKLLGWSLSKVPSGILLDLELQASELEEKTKTIARPKLVAQDGQTASIETGQEIPYTTVAQQGSTPITTFKTAVLKLEVTPHIASNNKIAMELNVTDDSPSRATFDGQVGINTTSMATKILINDGETIVLGGIFKINDATEQQSIPYLADIPMLGRIFRSSRITTTRNEVLIFVTPHIIDNRPN